MIDLITTFWDTFTSTITDVLPIAVILFGFQIFVIRQKICALPVVCQLNTVKTIVREDRGDLLKVIDLLLLGVEIFVLNFFELHYLSISRYFLKRSFTSESQALLGFGPFHSSMTPGHWMHRPRPCWLL